MLAGMPELTTPANGIELTYEVLGDPAGEPLVLVMGLGMQMIAWPDDFCAALGERGFQVIRFDNRDVGRSTWIEGPLPDVMAALVGDISSASYTLSDMAADTAGLLDALELEASHFAGASMGGMIVQTLAIEHPGRVRSLTSIMSTTGDRSVGQPSPAALPALLTPPPPDPAAYPDWAVAMHALIGSPGFETDADEIRAMAARSLQRGTNPLGVGRQLVGVLASGDRTAALGGVSISAAVIHGAADPLIDPSGGRATAAAIAGAELIEIEGMGHDLPRGAWPRIIDGIAAAAARAGAAA
jgi:pimeloyl-ACP methyl ester carboxylesterase